MDEAEYRELYHSVNSRRCCFEKAILTRRFGCSHLVKMNIADREAAGCADQQCRDRCQQLIESIRSNAAFSLKTTPTTQPLPHAKEIRAQCGGILGLYTCLHPEEEAVQGVNDINGTIEQAIQEYHGMERFPFADIIKFISHYQIRKKRGRKS